MHPKNELTNPGEVNRPAFPKATVTIITAVEVGSEAEFTEGNLAGNADYKRSLITKAMGRKALAA